MRKLLVSVAVIGLSFITLFQSTSAVFEETVKVAGTSFTVGTDAGGEQQDTNTALKMLVNLSEPAADPNLADSIAGPVFDNIAVDWIDQVEIKIHNQGTETLDIVSLADYVSDPDVLRDDLYVEILEWNDTNSDGVVDSGEEGTSYGYDTILRWRNDTFPLGSIAVDETRGFVMRFDGTGVTGTNFGMTAAYDFVFTGVGQ